MSPAGFKGFGVPEADRDVSYHVKGTKLDHGSLVLASITSCTNTSNPHLMLAAGLVAQKAVKYGLKVNTDVIKTTLSPGSRVVTRYLEDAGLQDALDSLGFYHAGYGCMTCMGNSGELDTAVSEVLRGSKVGSLVGTAVLSGNRNFESRVHPLVAGAYLASPPLVVAFALAGRVNIDFSLEPLGRSSVDGQPVFLRDVWPTPKVFL